MYSSFVPRAVRLAGPCRFIFRNPCREAERFSVYDISGRRDGTYRGDRIGEELKAGVYFLRPLKGDSRPVRIVKVR